MQLETFPFVLLFAVLWVSFVIALICALRGIFRWGLAPRNEDETVFHALAFLALILVSALAVLWRTPYEASNLGISDAVEYAVGAERMLHLGSYTLFIDGLAYPPRYPPWFSALFVAPAMIIAGISLGNSIWPVLLCALVAVACAFCVGRRLSGTWGGILAAFTLLLDPSFRYFSKFPMTDVPAAALTLVVVAYCLVLRLDKDSRSLSLVPPGVLSALLIVLRPASAAILLPVLWTAASADLGKGRLRRLLGVLAPVCFMCSAQFIYHTIAFGSPFRSGYQFWVPWPYDFPDQVFSLRYVFENAKTLLLHTPLLIFAVLFLTGWPVLKEKKEGVCLERGAFFLFMRQVLCFAIPLCVIYLSYFYSTSRFYLPLTICIYVLIGAFIGAFLGEIEKHRVGALLCLLIIAAGLAGWRASSGIEEPRRRVAAELLARHTPADALIVTAIDPAYLEPLVLRGTRRTLLPSSRRIEYASKVVAWTPLSYAPPYPSDVTVMQREYLLKSGAQDVIERTAMDDGGLVARAIKEGRSVYLDTSAMTDSEIEAFTKRYIMLEVAKNLFTVSRVWGGTS